MKKIAMLLVFALMSLSAVCADGVKVVVPTTKSTNYALYPSRWGEFLRLDTRTGKIDEIVPTRPSKSKSLNSKSLVENDKPGRFELYPTNFSEEWLLFDTETGDIWSVKLNKKGSAILQRLKD